MSTDIIVLGQRWISHSESHLGLGIISDVQGRLITVNFPAAQEQRTYARDNAPLARIQYAEGDEIRTMDDESFTVIQVLEERGLIGYLCTDSEDNERVVPEIELDCFVQLATPRQRLLSGQFTGNSAFRLKLSTLEQLNRLQQIESSGLLGARVELLPHQLYIASEVASRYAPRVLLADEVGLGKTIEAGLIIHKQHHSGLAERLLIIVPENLQHQWLVEMLRKFNLKFSIMDESRWLSVTEDSSNMFEDEQKVIVSLDFLTENPAAMKALLGTEWDLAVVDEAHHIEYSESEPSMAYQMLEQLAEHTPGLLLLTATPEQVGAESHFARLRLLDPARFHSFEAFLKESEQYETVNQLLLKLEQGKSCDEELQQLPAEVRKTVEQYADNLPRLMDSLLDQFGTGRVLYRNTRSTVSGFPGREINPMPLERPDSMNTTELYPEQSLLNEQGDEVWLVEDPRVSALVALLKENRRQKFLIITHHENTVKALDKFLNIKQGIRCTSFYPELSIIERDRAAAYFADLEAGAQVMICSEIGSEGRNFQFAHNLVLFDLPDNPDLIEQRIGRLDRIGQKANIQIHIPYLAGTAQEVMFRWYHEGLNLFLESHSGGYALHEQFADRLNQALSQPANNNEVQTLIEETASASSALKQALSSGRTPLLEKNSCNREKAQKIIQAIQEEQQAEGLSNYIHEVFDEFGLDHEEHSEQTIIVRPSEHMLSEHFPGLKDEGNTLTLSRDIAIQREDFEFLSWEHPMVTEVMDLIRHTELGNAAVASISIKGLKPGTLLLETCYTLESPAPKYLSLGKFMPLTPARLLVDINGKDLSKVVSHEAMNKLCQRIPKKLSRPLVEQTRKEIDKMLKASESLANAALSDPLSKALASAEQHLGSELERLKALQSRNPLVRESEIAFLEQQKTAVLQAIGQAQVQLQAIRLIING